MARRQTDTPGTTRRNTRLADNDPGDAAGMIGLAYAAVPLYQVICQVTGYGGTVQRAEARTAEAGAREITVRFDSNTSRDLDWEFKPEQREMRVKVGDTVLAFYKAHNKSDRATTGTATFNVTPYATGPYFSKVECFCFTEQTLAPNEVVMMPVSFYVDPEIFDDKVTKNVTTITLSYTFFPVKETAARDKAGTALNNSHSQGS